MGGRKKMTSEIMNINELIHKTFSSISVGESKKAMDIFAAWENVLSKIRATNHEANPNEGQNLIDHTRIVDLKNGVLLVEADHPGWISLLQMHKKFILKGMKMEIPGADISTLAFRLKGKRGDLYGGDENATSPDKVRAEIEKRIDEEEKKLSNQSFQEKNSDEIQKTRELPPELASIFEDLHKTMLTNSEK